MSSDPSIRVALAVGHGTGPDLADIFERILLSLAKRASLHVSTSKSGRKYHSYQSLLAADDQSVDVTEETLKDASHFQQFCEEEYARGARIMFRTAVSAQALYIVREQLEAIKVEIFEKDNKSLLLIRDQAQGFYSGYNTLVEGGNALQRTCTFSKDVFRRIVGYALQRAQETWGLVPETILMVYKFHLFDGLFFTWAQEWTVETGVKIQFVQPDTTNRNLLAFGLQKHCLMIAANEFADTMEPFFIKMFGKGGLDVQETAYGENVYLHPRVQGLVEYQTVHGSADDLVGKDLVNPSATIRSAAHAISKLSGQGKYAKGMDVILQDLVSRKLITPDQGGDLSTSVFVDLVLRTIAREDFSALSNQGFLSASHFNDSNSSNSVSTALSSTPDSSTQYYGSGSRSALIVMDFQNDFVSTGSSRKMSTIATNIPKAIEAARHGNQEVIFVRFLGDQQYQGTAWRSRNSKQRRRDHCLAGSWGAEIFGTARPQYGERVFDKLGVFDAFLEPNFAEYVRGRGFEELTFVGVYADICIDSSARTAFQKGLFVKVIRDCTTSLHIPEEMCLGFMQKVYGAEIVDSVDQLHQTHRIEPDGSKRAEV